MSAPQAAEVRGCFIARRLLEDEVFGGAWHLFTNAALFSGFYRRIGLQIEKYTMRLPERTKKEEAERIATVV